MHAINIFIFQWGRTPLIAACEGGHPATAQLLIGKGADLSTFVRPLFCWCLSTVWSDVRDNILPPTLNCCYSFNVMLVLISIMFDTEH